MGLFEDDDSAVAVAPDEVEPVQQKKAVSQQSVSPDEVTPVQRPLDDVTNPVNIQQPLAPARAMITMPPKVVPPSPGEAAFNEALPATSRSKFVPVPQKPPFLQPTTPAPQRMSDTVSEAAGGNQRLALVPDSTKLNEPPLFKAPVYDAYDRTEDPEQTPEARAARVTEAKRRILSEGPDASLLSGLTQGVKALNATTPKETSEELTPEDMDFDAPPDLVKGRVLIQPAAEASAEFLESLARPSNILTMGALKMVPGGTVVGDAIHTAANTYFGAQMGAAAVEGGFKSYEAAQQGDRDAAIREGVSAAMNALMAGETIQGASRVGADAVRRVAETKAAERTKVQDSAHPEDLVSPREVQKPVAAAAAAGAETIPPNQVTPAPEVNQNAVQQPEAGTVLQREPQQNAAGGDQRGRVEQGQQRPEAAGEGQTTEEAPQRDQPQAVSPEEVTPAAAAPVQSRPLAKSERAAIKEVGTTKSAVVLPAGAGEGQLLPKAKSAAVVTLPDGSRVVFDKSKASADDVLKLHSEGALHRLTGEKPPETVVAQAKQDLKGGAETFEQGSTQINIPKESELGKRHAEAVAAIPDEHLGVNGREESPHITLRYGLKDDSPEAVDRLREAAKNIAPFDLPLGKTDIFPPGEHSKGDNPVFSQVNVTPQLKELRGAIEKAGDFNADTFGKYKPHVTLGYVKPEFGKQYQGGAHLEGQKVRVDHIAVSKKDGTQEIIPLSGTGSLAARGVEATEELARSANPEWAKQPEEVQRKAAEDDVRAQADTMRMHLEEIADFDPELAKEIEAREDVRKVFAREKELASKIGSEDDRRRDDSQVLESPAEPQGAVREDGRQPQAEPAVPETRPTAAREAGPGSDEPSQGLENTSPHIRIDRREFTDREKTDIQDRAISAAKANPEEFIGRYVKDERSFGGRFINSDLMKEMFPEYSASRESRSKANDAVHNPAAALSGELYNRMVGDGSDPSRDKAYIVTGIPGAGKTTAYGVKPPADARVVYEGAMDNMAVASEKIDRALAAGAKPILTVVHASPEQAMKGVIKRHREIGRGASIETMSKIQDGLPDAVRELTMKYGDDLQVRIVDKSSGRAHTYKAPEHLSRLEIEGGRDGIRQRLRSALEAERDKGRVPEDAYRDIIPGGEAAKREGSGRQLRAARSGPPEPARGQEQVLAGQTDYAEKRAALKKHIAELESRRNAYPNKLTMDEKTALTRKAFAIQEDIGVLDAEHYKDNSAINDAMRDWKAGAAYIDNGGNYRMYGEKRGFDGGSRVAHWNKEAKRVFKDSAELGAAATHVYPTQEDAQAKMRKEREERERNTKDVAHHSDPLYFGDQQRYRQRGSWFYRNSGSTSWERVTDPTTKARFDKEFNAGEGDFKDLSAGTKQFDTAVERTGAEVQEGGLSQEFAAKVQNAKDLNLPEQRVDTLRGEFKEKTRFQREYFKHALAPALQGWRTKLGEQNFAAAVKKLDSGIDGDQELYVKVPDDGHFLVRDNPFSIAKAIKGADAGFARIKSRPFEEPVGKELTQRSPKEFDTEKYIAGLEKELDNLRDNRWKGDQAYNDEQIKAAEENLREAKALDTAADGKVLNKPRRSREAGFVVPSALGIEVASRAATKVASAYGEFIDKALEKVELGRPRPEIRKVDPEAADLAMRMDAGGQYHKAVGEAIAAKVTAPLMEDFKKGDSPAEVEAKNKTTRDRMKGFHFLADKQNREWLEANKPEDFARWMADPKIKQAIDNYKDPQGTLRAAVKELGGQTIDEDYIKRVMDFVTSGVTGFDEERARHSNGTGSRDNIVGPQVDRSHQRTADADFYWDHGVFDFGPSFEKRYSEVMHKLDENRLAVHVMSRSTRLESGDAMPDIVFYNGERFYRPEIAKEIREIQRTGSSADSQALAEELGVEELPLPKNVQEYGIYQPMKGARFERAAQNLAASAIEGEDSEVLKMQGYNVKKLAGLKYAVPKDLTDALNDAERTAGQGRIARVVSKLLSPVTQLIRQQVIGLGYGVPHMGNVVRKVIQATPGAQMNPLAWVNAVKVAFGKELKARAMSGVDDATYALLLRNAGISEGAVPEYKHYIEGNLDISHWKTLLSEPNRRFVGNAFREGGRARGEFTVKSSLAGIPRLAFEPLNRFSEAGHNNLFRAGGIDQRARLWMADMLKERFPKMSEAEIAHAVNQQLGRYNRASWTDVQRGMAPYMLFPGWDYSSVTYALRHPIKTTVPAAALIFLTNRAFHALGLNQDKDKNDLTRIHVGKRTIKTNVVSDNMGGHVLGWALRSGQASLDHKHRKDIVGAAVRGVPGDVGGMSVDMLTPVLAGIGQLAYGKTRSGWGQDIVPAYDLKKKGRVLPNKGAEDLLDFGARKAFPLYDNLRGEEKQRPDVLSVAGRLAGISSYEQKKKKR